jgi:N-acetyl-1-D-myo-inositol-2-amino-2-deoxy-alpha-D-glucopyranoside deacetylase
VSTSADPVTSEGVAKVDGAQPAARRLLLVHAHPDDETIGSGVTMAKYVAEGADVCLVTCTLGEEGEVLADDLTHLAAEKEDNLGPHRLVELNEAMAALGVTDFMRLGGDGRYRDSGMAYNENGGAIARTELRPGIFWTTDLLVAANELVPIIRSRRPQVLVTYDDKGGYGHPDHVQAHRVAMYACVLAGAPSYRRDLGPAWTVDRVLWTAMSQSMFVEGLRALRASGDTETWKGMEPDSDMPAMASPDEDIAAVVEGGDHVHAKMAAMRAHRSQIALDGPFFRMSEVLGNRAWSYEHFRLAAGTPFPGDTPATDLFAGLD